MSVGTEAEPIVLTEREIAICEGKDPDAIPAQQEDSPETGKDAGDKDVGDTDVPPGEPLSEPEPEPEPEPKPVKAAAKPEPKAESVEEPEWVNDDHKALAASYGIDDAELSHFESPGDFQRACRLIDRHLLSGRRPPPAETPPAPEGKQAPKPEPPKEEAVAQTDDELALDLEKYKEYDEETQRVVKVAKKLQEENKAIRDAITRVEQHRMAELHERELESFHDVVDSMDKNLFGGDDALTPEADKRRERLWYAFKEVQENARRMQRADGRPVREPPVKVLLQRAALVEFGDEILANERKKVTSAIHEQAKRRRPAPGKAKVIGSPGKSAEDKRKSMTLAEQAREVLADPEISTMLDKFDEENGSAPR